MKKRTRYIVIILVILVSVAVVYILCNRSNAPTVEFVKKLNNVCINKLCVTADGGYLLSGNALIRTDSEGETLWARNDYIYKDAVEAPDGDVVTICVPKTPKSSGMMRKINNAGNRIWAKRLIKNGAVQDTWLYRTPRGTFVAILNNANLYANIFEVDATGKILSVFGLDFRDLKLGILTDDNGFLLCGESVSSETILMKLDEHGIPLWKKKLPKLNDPFVTQTSDGGYIMSGNSTLMSGGQSSHLYKLDSRGDIEWEKRFDRILGNHAIQADDGGYVVFGNREKGNSFAVNLLRKLQELQSQPSSFKVVYDKGIDIITKLYKNINSPYDILMFKTDNKGEVVWAMTFPEINYLIGHAILGKQTRDGGFIVLLATTTGVRRTEKHIVKLAK